MNTIINRIASALVSFVSVSISDLVGIMIELRNGSHTFGSVLLQSIPEMRKTGNPFYGRVTKLAKWSFGVNTEYYSKLIKELERQGIDASLLTKEPSNYERYNGKPNCPVLKLKSDPSKLYLALFPNKDGVSFVEYYIDGRLATDFEVEQIKSFEYGNKPSAKQTALGIEEERQIKIRTVKLESIVAITLEGQTYKVE